MPKIIALVMEIVGILDPDCGNKTWQSVQPAKPPGLSAVSSGIGNAVSGFTTVILLVLLFSGIILIRIGIVAMYLAKVLDEVKGRPLYVVRKNPPVGSRGNGADQTET